jgi:hypothetical protein
MKLRVVLTFLAVIWASSNACAYNLIGQGTLACGTWTTLRQDRQALGLEQWVLGFLSGVGYEGESHGDNPLKGIDADTVWTWMDNYCRDHPQATISGSVAAFDAAHPH